MRDDSIEILSIGRKFIQATTAEDEYVLDYSDKSIDIVQALIISLTISEVSDEYKKVALASYAIYVGDVLKKKLPGFDFEVVIDHHEGLKNIYLSSTAIQLPLLDWVLESYKMPESPLLSLKYREITSRMQVKN